MNAFVAGSLPQKRHKKVDVNKLKSGRKKTRKYHTSNLNFGFTVAERESVEHPQCVICCKVLAADCLLPSKLKPNLKTNLNNLFRKPPESFARMLSLRNE